MIGAGDYEVRGYWKLHREKVELEARLKAAEDALRDIEGAQPKVLAYIEANGFVFEDIGNEPGNWQHLAFSLYTDLCEVDSTVRAYFDATGEHEDEKGAG